MADITPDDPDARLEADGAAPFVLDIRHRDDYEDWHVPGSENYDVDDQPKDDPEAATETLSEIPDKDDVITGDILFHESVGRVERGISAGPEDTAVERNAATLYESLQRLLRRSDETTVLPAHDPGSPEPPVLATLREVEERNEDRGRDREAFIEALASDVPERPPNFERVKSTNVGQESVQDEESADLELGPTAVPSSKP